MWVDEPNWNVQSSFLSPVTPPGVEPDSAPLVCVSFSQSWLPYVLGALMQLVQPAAWRGDPATVLTVLDQATGLVESVGAAEACPMPPEFRVTVDCLLQYSTDGGATWITVAGWTDFAATCFTGPPGATGATGPAGPASIWRLNNCALQYSNDGGTTWTTASGYSTAAIQSCLIGPPGNPQGVGASQQACNIAAYLAANVLQVSMQQLVSSYNSAQLLVNAVTALFDLIPGIDAIFGVAVSAAAILYNYYTSATISAFTTAATSATLLQELKCAIFGQIDADGLVDASNFGAVATAIAAIPYASSDVITALTAYWNALGVTGIEQLQLLGSTYVGDCSTCSGTNVNCGLLNGTDDYVSAPLAAGPLSTYTLGGRWFITSALATGLGLVGDTGDNGRLLVGNTPHPLQFNAGVFGPSAAPTGVWIHVVGVRSGSTCTLYLNGSSIASGTNSAALGSSIQIGKDPAFGVFLAGDVSGVRVYDVALTAGDVLDWFNTGVTSQDAHMVANWQFDEGSGTVVHDRSGHGNDGTWHGSGTHWSTY